jgi:hypothetical protein
MDECTYVHNLFTVPTPWEFSIMKGLKRLLHAILLSQACLASANQSTLFNVVHGIASFLTCCVQAATCIDLVNQHGSEGLLEKAFAKEAQRYASSKGAPLTYVAFDFHKECGAKNYDR